MESQTKLRDLNNLFVGQSRLAACGCSGITIISEKVSRTVLLSGPQSSSSLCLPIIHDVNIPFKLWHMGSLLEPNLFRVFSCFSRYSCRKSVYADWSFFCFNFHISVLIPGELRHISRQSLLYRPCIFQLLLGGHRRLQHPSASRPKRVQGRGHALHLSEQGKLQKVAVTEHQSIVNLNLCRMKLSYLFSFVVVTAGHSGRICCVRSRKHDLNELVKVVTTQPRLLGRSVSFG